MDAKRHNVSRFFVFLSVALLMLGAAVVGFTLYERFALGAIRLGTGDAPSFAPYYLVRLAVLALLVMMAVGGLYRRCDDATVLHKRSLSS